MYLDNAATSPVDKRVFDAMRPFFMDEYGNPSAKNSHAISPRNAVKLARDRVAELLGAKPKQIIFNSGSTESINHVLKSLFFKAIQQNKNHLIVSKIEHKAVLETAKYLETLGCKVTEIDVDENGIIKVDQISQLISENTFLICLMYVNNETGVIQPIKEITEIAKQENIPVFSDATQAVGKLKIDLLDLQVDYLCYSGHKINGPKGVGVLYSREQGHLEPLIHGGGQEHGKRGGTQNVPGIVGLGMASEIANLEMSQRIIYYNKKHQEVLVDIIGDQGLENFQDAPKVPNILSITLLNQNNEDFIVKNQNKLSISTGSACSSGLVQESHVLKAIPGIEPNRVIRISI